MFHHVSDNFQRSGTRFTNAEQNFKDYEVSLLANSIA